MQWLEVTLRIICTNDVTIIMFLRVHNHSNFVTLLHH